MTREDFKRNDIDPKKHDLIFQALDWYPTDIKRQNFNISLDDTNPDAVHEEEADDPQYCVKCFGVDSRGRSIGLTIFDYKPFFFVHIKGLDFKEGNTYKHIKSKILDELNVKFRCQISDVSMVEKVNLYGFTNGEKIQFLKLTFPNWRSFKHASYNFKSIRFRSREFPIEHFESNLEPHLRMLHILDVQPSGWIKITAGEYRFNDDHLVSSTTLDLETSWENLQPHTAESIAPLVVASFDIECTSSHGDFPMAIKSYNKTARELNEYYKSLTQSKQIFHTKKEVKDKIQFQLFSLFDIEHDMEMSETKRLTYVNPKNTTIEKTALKFAIENHTYDLIHLMKDKPKSEKAISDFFRKELNIAEPKSLIQHLKTAHEKMTRFDVVDVKVRRNISTEMQKFNTHMEPYKFQMKVSNNMECIMALFDKKTVFDKISDKFLKMGFPPLEGDPIIQIGTTFHKYGSKECFFKSIITLKSVDDIDDADEIIECKKERDVIIQWRQTILNMDPDVIAGYNIFGFDNGYIYDRAKELRILGKVQNLGRLTDFKFDKYNPSFVVKELQSSALGQNILKYFNMHGRVQIDLMKLVQKDYKLDSYKLDTVASTFITGKITSVIDHSNVTIDVTQGVHPNHFIQIDDIKFRIMDMNGNHLTIDNPDLFDIDQGAKWGLVKDDVSPNDIFRCQNGTDADRARIAKYCIQDCSLCNYLIMKLEVIANNIGMSNVCLVPLSYIFLRGQGIKIFSLVSKQCLDDGFIVPVVRKASEDTDESYEGAIVLTPDIGIYSDPISVLDFASLYPSSMISENISHDSIVLDDRYDNIPGIEYIDIQYEVDGALQTVRFAQFEKQGIMPRILKKLLKQRKTTRKKINYKTISTRVNANVSGLVIAENDDSIDINNLETNTVTRVDKSDITGMTDTFDEFQQAVLDGLQLAYKITANSLYGQVGAKTSPIFLKELAASTTATGRNLVLKLKDFAEENYDCKVVYGDSVMPYTPILLKQNEEVFVKEIQFVESGGAGGDHEWKPHDHFLKSGHNKQKLDIHSGDDLYTWTHEGWQKIVRVIRHKTQKRIYRITTGCSIVDVTEDHSLLTANMDLLKPGSLTIGQILCHLPYDSKDAIFKTDFLKHAFEFDVFQKKIACEGQYEAQVAFIYFSFLGLECDTIDQIGETYTLHFSSRQKNDAMSSSGAINQVRKIELLKHCYEDFVYDIETEVGTFQAGIGNMIVKNTDSIFIKFLSLPDENGNELTGKDRLQASIDKSIKVSEGFDDVLERRQQNVHKAEYEKTFFPFIILSKKRYVGNLYEHDVNKFNQKSMGIVLKRRDNANILKKIYGGMIDIILNQNDVPRSISYLKNQLTQIQNESIPMNDLIISKTLKGSYADPSKIGHKVLADRMFERDPGSAPQVNDRVQYLYIHNPDKKALQGDRIEDPEFIKANDLKIDYCFYISNQILKPVSQLLSLVVERIPGYRRPATYFQDLCEKFKKQLKEDKLAKDKVQAMKETEVEKLIFEPVLTSIRKKMKNQKSIYDFFN